MNSTEEITAFINAVRELNGVGICYYDLNQFFHYDRYGIKDNRGHYCAFCERVRELPNGKDSCVKSDKSDAVQLAMQYREPFFFECHMGMRELVIPLMRDDVLIGILFVGQCRTDNDNDEVIASNIKRMNGDPDELLRLFNALPLISQKDLLNIGKILLQYFELKIMNNELLYTVKSPDSSNRDLAETIHHYIQNNYKFRLTPKGIADAFHVNASYASRRFSQRYNMTITDYISHIRIERAKTLLQTTEAPIGNIALNVGFNDVNYFSRVFRKIVGCSPYQYRKVNQKSMYKSDTN